MLCCKDVRLKKSCRVSAGHARSDGDVPDAQVHEARFTCFWFQNPKCSDLESRLNWIIYRFFNKEKPYFAPFLMTFDPDHFELQDESSKQDEELQRALLESVSGAQEEGTYVVVLKGKL